MFETGDVLIYGTIAGLIAAAITFVSYPWARARMRFLVAGIATFLGFVAWNLVVSHGKASGLNVDAPVVALSWQDAGSGVLSFAATSLALGVIEPREPAIRVTTAAVIAGLAAMIFDVFVL